MIASPSCVKISPRPVAAIRAPASSASPTCSPGMNFCVARFTNALRRAKSLRRRLRAAASRTERPKATLGGDAEPRERTGVAVVSGGVSCARVALTLATSRRRDRTIRCAIAEAVAELQGGQRRSALGLCGTVEDQEKPKMTPERIPMDPKMTAAVRPSAGSMLSWIDQTDDHGDIADKVIHRTAEARPC